MDINRLTHLAKKYFENNNTAAEQQELAALVQKARDNAQLKKVLEQVWETYQPGAQMPDEMSDRVLNKLFSQAGEAHGYATTNPAKEATENDATVIRVRRFPAAKYISVAASLALVFTLTWWLSRKDTPQQEQQTHIVSTQKGSRLKARLPDGTTVWLNAGSLLEYDNDFGKSDRKVSLTGEAFFDVSHNKEKPFIIHTAAFDLKVLGTTFNVRAYPEEKRTEASLITGMLEVSFANLPSHKLVLKPAEKISIANESNAIDSMQIMAAPVQHIPSVSSVTYQPGDSSVIETSWVNNKLVFRNKPFEEVALELSRWYNVNFDIRDTALLSKRFTGTFETETIYEALTRLSESYSFLFMYDKQKKLFIIDK